MEGLGDPRPGVGPGISGPEFVPAPPLSAPPAPQPPVVPVRSWAGPPRSRVPTLVTTLSVALVAIVVVVASLVAHHADTHVAAPRPAPPVVLPSVTERPDRIEFTTSTGSGELILLRRTWAEDGFPVPAYGTYLKVEVEIACTAGSLAYDPNNFQAFDHTGRLFGLSLDNADDPPLEIGTLDAGMRVRGSLAFDIPHGDVTLLMSEDNEQSVTALRVPV